jgi:pimeloyl-ACP methyl ester carboxylesterase
MPALAEVVVLVPGYLSDADGWRASGVGRALAEAGWRDGGDLRWGPRGPLLPHATALGPRSFYTVALPTEAPLAVQARFLTGYVDALRPRHPGEGVTLVGHSAGGVVARLYMVQNPDSGVGALVTFASPHLGTETAEIASLLGQTPLAWVAPLIGAGTLNRSQGLYRDLSRENPQGVLFWLNRQPHPPARYVSVVRADPGLLGVGDVVVPEWSQDLNNVLALRGRASRVSISAGHGLSPEDGEVLTRILAGLGSS